MEESPSESVMVTVNVNDPTFSSEVTPESILNYRLLSSKVMISDSSPKSTVTSMLSIESLSSITSGS